MAKSKVWLRRLFLRCTQKGHAIRQLASEFGLPEQEVVQLVSAIERDAVTIARQVCLEAKQEADRQARARIASSFSGPSSQSRPPNQYTSGARLSSPRR